MDPVCLVLALLPGKEEVAREFLVELDRTRNNDYARSQRNIGISKEVWFLTSDSSPKLVAYIETKDFALAVGTFAASQGEFDQWFKIKLAECTGVDLNNPPHLDLPEVLSNYKE